MPNITIDMVEAAKADFDREPRIVMPELRGQVISTDKGQVQVMALDGYSRAENEKRPIYRPMLTMKPGEVFICNVASADFFLIVCRDGSCVALRGAYDLTANKQLGAASKVTGVLLGEKPAPGKNSHHGTKGFLAKTADGYIFQPVTS